VARPPTVDREEILAAARAVLREHGVRATTALVAERAGISEGSIFNRFPTKRALFRAAIEPMFGSGPWTRALPQGLGTSKVPGHLVEVGVEMARFFRTIIPIIVVSIAEAGGPDDAPPPSAIAAQMRRLADYLEAEARAGRMRPHDSLLLARAFVGAIFHFVFLDVTIGMARELPLGAEDYVRGVVDLLWHGLAPEPPKKAQRPAGSKHRSR
jgi:AcrR family transcriptional regulator